MSIEIFGYGPYLHRQDSRVIYTNNRRIPLVQASPGNITLHTHVRETNPQMTSEL